MSEEPRKSYACLDTQGNTQYNCTDCAFIGITFNDLRSHVAVYHHKEVTNWNKDNYRCKYCIFKGTTIENLTLHIKDFHKEEYIKEIENDIRTTSDTLILESNTLNIDNSTIDHPKHYNTGKIEVIDFIEDQKLGFHLGNVVKYICRERKSNNEIERLEDLEKAIWYLKRYIEKEMYLDHKRENNVI